MQLYKQTNGNKSYRDIKKVSHTLIKQTQNNSTIKVKLWEEIIKLEFLVESVYENGPHKFLGSIF